MAVIGTPRSFHKKFKFVVEIDDVAYAGFQKCSELSVEVAKIEHYSAPHGRPASREGAPNAAHPALARPPAGSGRGEPPPDASDVRLPSRRGGLARSARESKGL
jgi:hypothetical protein